MDYNDFQHRNHVKAEFKGCRRPIPGEKANAYFGIKMDDARCINIVTIESDLSPDELDIIRREVFTNPVIQESGLSPLDI